MENARTASRRTGQTLGVSPGNHSRSRRENEAGRSAGGASDVSPKQLGYDVGRFIGIILKAPKTIPPHWSG